MTSGTSSVDRQRIMLVDAHRTTATRAPVRLLAWRFMPLPATKIISRASIFAREFAAVKHPDLLGVTDGKAVGTYIETAFKKSLHDIGIIEATEGNAAKGIDLPSFDIDIKVTSVRQPQSSSA
jgi:hypothetical protein